MTSFFSPDEEKQILEAIRQAELKTSGEIKLHVEKTCDSDPYARAQNVFFALRLQETAARNAVLIYWAQESRKIAILGDQGIHSKVPSNFWQSTKNQMISHFREGNYIQALVTGILEAGNQLKTYFPYHDQDQNEIPNDISFG